MINKKNTIKALNNYISTINKNHKYKLLISTVSEIDFIGRMPQIMAIALWKGDNSDNNQDIAFIIKSYDHLINHNFIPD